MPSARTVLVASAALLATALGVLRCDPASSTCDAVGDGISGGDASLLIVVDDDAFRPGMVTAQNLSTVTLTLKNEGTRPHGFTVGCVATPNHNGCPSESCFPDAATIAPIPPDRTATTTFVAPDPESLYPFRSTADGDTQTGQFHVN